MKIKNDENDAKRSNEVATKKSNEKLEVAASEPG